MAMVAKQGWNLLTKPDALVTKLLKARYFSRSSFFDASLGAEANNILAVPLLDMIQEDRLIWNEERDGVYSIRSGHRKLMKDKKNGEWPRVKEPWGRIWKIQAPPKAKHLLWRLCKECLPSRRLRRKKDSLNVIQPRLTQFHSIKEVILDVCCNESNVVAGKVAMVLWTLWNNRNNFVWYDTKMTARQIGSQAIYPYGAAATTYSSYVSTVATTNTRLFEVAGGAFEIILGDSFLQAQILSTRASTVNTIEGEALAWKEAIHEVIQRGISHVIFESDSKVVVDAIASRSVGT
ncbi:unnamed protein product [Trifolium pratense]|uniref:Uncharacterized protein n=1 Tax=Trifolium pratense TaxID=57577 RepID=A0ACB0KA08_TRIPR|nr:unnamed protein product [Trifolium pratense]